jgi:hypothetical protein
MSAAAIPFASLALCGADPAPAALPSITAVHVRLRTDIVNLYGLSVCVAEHISSQLWTLAARQCVALFF